MLSKQVIINNETGLHARPASMLVKEASKYQSEITITVDDKEANAKSIMSVLALGAKKGQTVQIRVNGLDEENALQGVHSLFEQNFGE
ncbi:HPr family phosphocarrier protein [Tepidibacillus sp. HK-1]|uniref:HPr family phosphocarrier protein n=1 Tax=Tepidibacillus sp. HK-1 TaxID=1883407 RepID=UPI000853E099|nr:HPr family phosphocarrier protein [Tepidibacillus sp. HK-1]GBF10195.1 phosphocarrier protein HPr [Tepidibacillus sp. HK-1]